MGADACLDRKVGDSPWGLVHLPVHPSSVFIPCNNNLWQDGIFDPCNLEGFRNYNQGSYFWPDSMLRSLRAPLFGVSVRLVFSCFPPTLESGYSKERKVWRGMLCSELEINTSKSKRWQKIKIKTWSLTVFSSHTHHTSGVWTLHHRHTPL